MSGISRPLSTPRLGMALFVVLPLAASFPAAGQEQMPTFRSTTRLVEVNVTALDKKGDPITDLKAEDFQIQASGKSKKLALFRFEGEQQKTPEPEALPPGVFTNRVEATPGPPRNITALVLDTLNTKPEYNAPVRAQMLRYLQVLAPETRVAVYSMSAQLQVLHDFTDDLDSLRERLGKAMLGMQMQHEVDIDSAVVDAEALLNVFDDAGLEEILRVSLEVDLLANAASQRNRLLRSLDAMDALGRHLAGIPGRKSLIWITGGFSMLIVSGEMGSGTRGQMESYENAVRETARQLAQRGVSLYIVDAAGLQQQMELKPTRRTAVRRGRGRFEGYQQTAEITADPRSTMEMMASITGGRYLNETNDMARGFRQAVNDVKGSYTLGFYDDSEPDDKWHQLKVKVKRSGVRLRHRQGYLAQEWADGSQNWTPDTWQRTILNPIGSSAIRLTATCNPVQDGDLGSVDLELNIETDNLRFREDGGKMLGDIEIMIANRTAEGMMLSFRETAEISVPASEWGQAQERGVQFTRRWTPDDDTLGARILVRDTFTSEYGTLDLPKDFLVPEPARLVIQ